MEARLIKRNVVTGQKEVVTTVNVNNVVTDKARLEKIMKSYEDAEKLPVFVYFWIIPKDGAKKFLNEYCLVISNRSLNQTNESFIAYGSSFEEVKEKIAEKINNFLEAKYNAIESNDLVGEINEKSAENFFHTYDCFRFDVVEKQTTVGEILDIF